MRLGGFQRFTLCDYPGEPAAVVFTLGCNMRCRYCHNPELVVPERYAAAVPEADILSFLARRRGQLRAVTVTGGEPTLQPDLPDFLRRLKSLGYLVKLDTNGSHPDALRAILSEGLADYVAMDVKAPLGRYVTVTAAAAPAERLLESIRLVIASGVDHEFRTTVTRGLTTADDLRDIAETVRGGARLYLQRFVPSKHVDPSMASAVSPTEAELQALARELRDFVGFCGVR